MKSITLKTRIVLTIPIYLSVFLVCSPKSQKSTNIQPVEYALKDTLQYKNTIYGGKVSVLYVNNNVIDTVDSGFGVQRLSKTSLLYHRFSLSKPEPICENKEGLYGFLGDYVLYRDGSKKIINEMLPFFDGWFSSPALIDSMLYYWGLNENYYYAMRYDFAASRTDSLFLFNSIVGTDDPGFFQRPVRKNSKIYFSSNHSDWLIGPSLQSKKLLEQRIFMK